MEKSETTIPDNSQLDELVFKTSIELGLDRKSEKYNYDEVYDILKKYIYHQLNILDLIKPEEIFDLFLIKFRTDIMGEEIVIKTKDEKEKEQ